MTVVIAAGLHSATLPGYGSRTESDDVITMDDIEDLRSAMADEGAERDPFGGGSHLRRSTRRLKERIDMQ